MFFHIFKYRVITLLKDKVGLFWMFFFPIVMSLLFYMVIPNEFDSTLLNKIPLSVTGTNEEFTTILNESNMFEIVDADPEKASEMLDSGEIYAIVNLDGEISIEVKTSDIYQTLIKTFADTYSQRSATYVNVMTRNPEAHADPSIFEKFGPYTSETPINGNTNPYVVYFYTLLAMTSIMCGTLAIDDIAKIQANQSATAARNNIAPTHKLKIFTANTFTTMLFHFCSTMLVVFFMQFILGIDLSVNIGWIMLLMFVATFSGIMLGSLISIILKTRHGIKLAIIIGYSVMGSMFAGMAFGSLRYYTMTYLPVLHYMLPPCVVTDALYSLYYYPTLDRYFFNLLIIAGVGVASCIASYLVLRRQKYASI